MTKIKKTVLCIGKDVEDLELSYTTHRKVKWYNWFGKQFVDFEKLSIHLQCYSRTTFHRTLRCLLQRNENIRKGLYMSVRSSSIRSSPKLETDQMSVSRRTDKQMWHFHAMECCSAINESEVLLHITTWGDLKIIMLSERKQIVHSV